MQTAEALIIANENRKFKCIVSPCSLLCQVAPSDSTKNMGIDVSRQKHGVTSQRLGTLASFVLWSWRNAMRSPVGGLADYTIKFYSTIFNNQISVIRTRRRDGMLWLLSCDMLLLISKHRVVVPWR